jgi:hypothetical protein
MVWHTNMLIGKVKGDNEETCMEDQQISKYLGGRYPTSSQWVGDHSETTGRYQKNPAEQARVNGNTIQPVPMVCPPHGHYTFE